MSNYAQKLQWHHVYGTGLKQRVSRVGAGFRLNIPGPGGSINYVWTNSAVNLYPPGKRQSSHAMSLRCHVTMSEGAVVVDEQDDDPGTMPPTMRIMLMRSMGGANNRWFASTGVVIAPGAYSVDVPLAPENWSNVWGKYPSESPQHLRDWKRMFERSLRLALVFGAGNDYGHGVQMQTGSCQIQVTSYRHLR